LRLAARLAIIAAVEQDKDKDKDVPLFDLVAVLGEQPVRDVPHAKFLRTVQELAAPLKDIPAHGNRKLHLHPLVITLIFSFYDPLIRSLRSLEAFTTKSAKTAAAKGLPELQRMARSTLSDAMAAFDPELLKPLIRSLQRQVPQLGKRAPELAKVLKEVVAGDGTYMTVFSNAVMALIHTKSNRCKQGQVRLNFQMNVADWVPRVVSVSGKGDGSEPDAFAADLLPGVLYVNDRNFVDFGYINAVLAKESDIVQRIKKSSPAYEIIRSRPLTTEDIEQGVLSDDVVRLTGRDAPAGEFRVVGVRHASKPEEVVKLLTNLVADDISATTIGYIYSQRWQIELFFRWLKLWCNFDHLLNTSREGITLQFYCIMIAQLLMHIHLGRRVSKYTLIALHRMACGQMTFAEAQDFLGRRDRENELAKARLEKKRAAKKV
jgi:hypothetical protein